MKVAILGSNGFLGNYFTKNLSSDYDLIPVSRQVLDLTDSIKVKEWLEINTPDVIINCAINGGKLTLKEKVYDDIQKNLIIFLNFYNNSKYFKKYINIGSGAEFNIFNSINNAKEEDILHSFPTDSYSYSKNIISRLVLEKPNFYTLRIFGCFDSLEPDYRLLKKFSSVSLQLFDRKFDYISASDLCKIVDYYINNDELIKDINCVYSEKFMLSDILSKFNNYKKIKIPINVIGINDLNYTGDSSKLETLKINLDGLDLGLQKY
jgi:nucleoside-diphosphate-sugar epimerase